MPSLRASRAAWRGAAPPKAISVRSAVSLPFSTACTRAALAMVSSTISATPAAAPAASVRAAPASGSQRRLGLVAIKRNRAAGEALGIEAAQRSVGVGDGGLGAAAAVAGRAGLAAGADPGRPACGPARRGGRSSRRRRRSRPARSPGCAPAGRCPARSGRRAPTSNWRERCRLAVVEQAELGRGAAHVEGDGLGEPVLAPRRSSARMAPPAGPDSTRRMGKRRAVSTVVMPPDGHHQQQRAGDAFAS